MSGICLIARLPDHKGSVLFATGDELEANANLISAAPDLLEVLQELFVLGDVYSSAIESTGPNIDLEAWEVKAKAAIAKALGEQG